MKRLAMLVAISASCAAAMAQPGQSIAQLASDKAALRKAMDYCQDNFPSLAISATTTVAGWHKRHERYLAQAGAVASRGDALLAPLRAATAQGNGELACEDLIEAISAGKYDLSAPERQAMDGMLGGTPAAPSAAQTRRTADAASAAAAARKIKKLLVYDIPKDLVGNPKVIFQVTIFKDGEILAIEQLLRSGHPDYDAAVLRAINQASPLPIQVEGASTRQITLSVLMR
jgi:TonB family protein